MTTAPASTVTEPRRRHVDDVRDIVFENERAWRRAMHEAAVAGTLRERKCPVCNVPASPARGRYVTCSECGLRFMTPILDRAHLERHLGFDGQDSIMRRYWDLRLRSAAARAVDTESDPVLRDVIRYHRSGRLLDVGCGLGEFLRTASRVFTADGVEINPELRRAAAGHGVDIAYARLADVPLQPGYDVIVLQQLLYGLVDPVRILTEVRRRLRPGGIVYVNTPNAESLAVKAFGLEHSHFLSNNLNVFTLRSLERLATRAGLRLVEWRTEWLDVYPGDIVARWLFARKFLHRRNSFLPGYRRINAWIDRLDRRWLTGHLGRRGDYLVAVLERAERENR